MGGFVGNREGYRMTICYNLIINCSLLQMNVLKCLATCFVLVAMSMIPMVA